MSGAVSAGADAGVATPGGVVRVVRLGRRSMGCILSQATGRAVDRASYSGGAMSFLDKARQTATQGFKDLASPENKAEVSAAARELAGQAKRGVVTVIEKIDPDTLADLIVKATAIQEKANAALTRKGSAYRIGDLTITATIPPQIGFAITRIGDLDEVPPEATLVDSSELEARDMTPDVEVVSLEGQTLPLEDE